MTTVSARLTDDDGIFDRICSCKERHARDDKVTRTMYGHTFEPSLRIQQFSVPIGVGRDAQRHQTHRAPR